MSKIDEMIPPESMIFVGSGDFKSLGEEFLKLFVELGGLRPDHRVLDVGCGIGRMAIPLTQFLDDAGSYEGFDVVKEGVQWCQEKISTRYPHFQFQLADVINKLYNPQAWRPASSYRFKYGNGKFDFVFLTSVFTHMLPDVMENYLSEISRVLAPGGRAFITMFLLNEEAESLLATGKSHIQFPHSVGQCRVSQIDIPEHAVAYPEGDIRELYAKHRLTIQDPIHFGNWCGREQFTSFQDIIVATKA